jgi:hypothetical protein
MRDVPFIHFNISDFILNYFIAMNYFNFSGVAFLVGVRVFSLW